MKPSRLTLSLTGLLTAVVLVVFCCLPWTLLPLVQHALLGWIYFLGRVLPDVRINPSALVTGCLCLGSVVGGVHWFGNWLAGSLPRSSSAASPRRWSFLSTLAFTGIIVLAFTAGIAAVGVTHQVAWLATSPEPMMSRNRTASHRAYSQNNLKQIGTAYHTNEAAGKALPSALDEHGRALHGWMTHLLPYIEHQDLYAHIDIARSWDDPVNAPHFHTPVRTYAHPGAPAHDTRDFPLAHYALNARLIAGGRIPGLEQIAEERGTANTILTGEAHGDWKPWGHPINWRDPGKGINRSPDGFGSPVRPAHSVQFGMADGSVRSFSTDTDPDFLAMLARPDRK